MIKIEDFDHQGRGIGKLNNKIVFVKNALPNEIVNIKIKNEKRKYIEAIVTNYIEKSHKRINPICPYYEKCGGCHLMHISYDDQLNFKQDKINNIVSKYLNQSINVNKIVKSDNNLYYRNKTTFQVNNKLGFFKENSNELIKIEKCFICNNSINNAIPFLNLLDLKKIKKIVCKSINKKLMIIIYSKTKNINIDCLKQIASSIYININNIFYHIYGTKEENEIIDKYSFTISPDSFFQINIDIAKKILNKIKIEVGSNKTILDLYCGTGIIGIYVSDNNKVTGVEINKQAYMDAIKNKKNNKIKNINFICNDSGKSLKSLNINPDILIIDPPRGGLNKETINNILELKCKKIIYVSCNPLTLVRDLNTFKNLYNITEITPYDMFPQTYHVESIAVLERK